MKKYLVVAALVMVAMSQPVVAAPVEIDFTFTSVFDGPLPNGTTASGSFSFDDSIIPVGGSGLVTDFASGIPLAGAAFTWAGKMFDLTNVKLPRIEFDSGIITNLSLHATTDISTEIYFNIDTFIKNSPFGGYGIPSGCFPSCFGRADVAFGPSNVINVDPYVNPIPEPGTLALLSAAGIAAFMRRRKGTKGE